MGRDVAGPAPLPHVHAYSVSGRQPGQHTHLSSLSLTAQLLSSAFLGVRDKRVNAAWLLWGPWGQGSGSAFVVEGNSDSRDLDTT